MLHLRTCIFVSDPDIYSLLLKAYLFDTLYKNIDVKGNILNNLNTY